MEPDFDKEIDALLRKETAGRTITISEFAGGLHLDADEITAFAEKKVPPGVRDSFIEHFAACDRCRKVLLNAAWLNAEDESAEQASIAAPVEAAVPWYRRLFIYPNLAYVMGGLVVLFAGFIGVSVYTSLGGREAVVSQADRVSEMPATSGGPAAPEYAANTNSSFSANAANTTANASTNAAGTYAAPPTVDPAAANMANTATQPRPAIREEDDAARNQDVAVTAAPPAAAPPPPPAKENSFTLDGVESARVTQEKRAAAKPEDKDDAAGKRMVRARPLATPAPVGAAPKAKTPVRDGRTDAQAAETELSLRKVEPLPAGRNGQELVTRKQVSGRTFELRNGVWYETSYRGQGTVNVRRNTDEYRKLDRGLRGIAESLIGTVVAVWNGKAYRIY